MTGTTLDAVLCIVLVSAAAGTLVTSAPAVPAPDRADDVAETLATSTAEVEYSLAPGARRAAVPADVFPTVDGPEFRRVAHGTLLALASEAALGNASVAGRELTHTSDDFEQGVRHAVLTAFPATNVQLVAVWRPYPGARLAGRFTAGPSSPPNRDVRAATLTVPSGFPQAHADAVLAAETEGYAGVARVVATRLMSGLFPPAQSRLALGDDYPVAPLLTYRYRRVAEHYDAEIGAELEARDVEAVNARLASALAPAVERDLRRQFATPTAAARAVRLATVRVVVRTWA